MQLGHTLDRILQKIAYANPLHGPPLLLKFDLSDGYYQVCLLPEASLELAVVTIPVRTYACPPFKTVAPIPDSN